MHRLTYGGVEAAKLRHATRRRLTRERILQHVQSASQGVSTDRISSPGEADVRGASCARVHVVGQFVAMLFCQLGRAHSLREICGGLRSSEGKLKHLGIAAPSRSTLAYANEHRPWQLYRAVFEALLLRCQPLAHG